MIAALKKLFAPKRQEVGLQAFPVLENPGTGIRVERNDKRLERLRLAYAAETDDKRKAALADEIARRERFGK